MKTRWRAKFGGLTLLVAGIAGILFTACFKDHTTQPINPPAPRKVKFVLDDDSLATRDTLLRARTDGENIDIMRVSLDSAFAGAEWEQFSRIKILYAPRQEGSVVAYGRFATAGGETTGTFSDTIKLDFTANIAAFEAGATSDTLTAGDDIDFQISVSEMGTATVSFSTFLSGFELDSISPGEYYGKTTIPRGVMDSIAVAVAHFTDYAGNEAIPVASNDTFFVSGGEAHPQFVSRILLEGLESGDIYWVLGHCFVSDWHHAVHIFDVSNPNSPTLIRTIGMGDRTAGMAAGKYFLYVADGDAGLGILNPVPPVVASLVKRFPIAGQVWDVAIDAEIAYVTCNFTGLQVYNLTDAESPRGIAELLLAGYGECVTYDDRRLYVSGQSGGALIDVSNPQNPQLLSEFSVPGIPRSSTYFGGYFYFTTEERGIVVFDVRDPRQPQMAAEYQDYKKPYGLTVAAPYLLVGGDNVVWVLNLANPRALREVGRVGGVGLVRVLRVQGDYIYAGEDGGMSILRLYGD